MTELGRPFRAHNARDADDDRRQDKENAAQPVAHRMLFHGWYRLNSRPRVSLSRAPHDHQLQVATGRAPPPSMHGQPPFSPLRLFTEFGKARAPGWPWRSYCLGLFCRRLLCFGLFLERKGVQGTAAGALGPRGWSHAFCAPRAWRAPRLPLFHSLRRWQGRAHRVVPRRPVSVVFPSVFARRNDRRIVFL